MPRIPSEQEQSAQRDGDFKPLPEDDYIVVVKDYKVEDDPNPYNNGIKRPVLKPRLKVISFSNGDPLVDVDDDPIPANRDVLFFDFLDTEKTGFGVGGPSRYRQFLAAVFGRPVSESIEFDDWNDILDKPFIASAVLETKKGKTRNKVTGYKAARRRRATAAAEPVAVASRPAPAPEADLVKAAADIFADDGLDDLPF